VNETLFRTFDPELFSDEDLVNPFVVTPADSLATSSSRILLVGGLALECPFTPFVEMSAAAVPFVVIL
jgi:hypothetical protein